MTRYCPRNLPVLALFAAMAGLSACGGDANLTCDDPERYQQAGLVDKVKVPEDLDELDEIREIPLPEAAPSPPRPAGSPCIDRPPDITITE